ncbi:MAG: SpaH/EbpB family LPXTG-anchored major pilin [Ruminococcus sp.]|nr:SpaH/EbpB family LPXTG-anchored major pilin [Ruminococcus sp.]
MKMAKILKAVASAFVAGALAATAMFSAVSAATQTADLTITGTNENHSYEAYQIFAGDLEGSTLSNIVWGSGIADGDALLTALESQVDLGGVDYSSATSAADVAKILAENGSGHDSTAAQAFADFISDYLATSPSATATVASGNTAAVFDDIEVGYYLVKDADNTLDGEDEAYTRFIIKIVGDASAAVKSSTPTVDKQVYDDDDSAGWNDVADYDIGDAVPFKLTGTMPSTLGDYETYTYIFHDTLSDGLTLDSTSIAVTIDGVTIDSSAYTVKTGEDTCGCTFEVAFTDIISAATNNSTSVTLSNSSQVIVTYNATLNSNAVIGLNGNPNEVYLEYSNNPNQGGEGDTGSTPEEYALVFTYKLDVTKVDGDDNTKVLEGAEFVLYDEAGNYAIVDENGKVTGWATDIDNASTLTSDADGNFVVIGLDEGTYYLKETKAPAGYNLLSSPITVVINATDVHNVEYDGTNASSELTAIEITVNGTANSGDPDTGTVSATVENNSGSVLPETGGIGTTIFYVGGAIIVAGAVILLIVKRRMKTAE